MIILMFIAGIIITYLIIKIAILIIQIILEIIASIF